MSKSVTVSVRLGEEDAAFLAQLSIPAALTPSDKLRALIREARQRHGSEAGYEEHLAALLDTLRPLEQKLRAYESGSGEHSELATGFPAWLADAFAFAQSASVAIQSGKLDPKAFERGTAKRVFRLLEWAMRMGVTRQAPCYDAALVEQSFRPLRELVALLHQRLNEETKNG